MTDNALAVQAGDPQDDVDRLVDMLHKAAKVYFEILTGPAGQKPNSVALAMLWGCCLNPSLSFDDIQDAYALVLSQCGMDVTLLNTEHCVEC